MLKRCLLELRVFYCPLLIVVLTILIQALGFDDLLDFDRPLINAGSWWLLITGHLCHLDWQHLILNNAALLIIWELFYRGYSPIKAVFEFFTLGLVISFCIYLFNPQIQWYVGLSGILHGLFVIGIAKDIFRKNWISIVVAFGFIAKIVWEQSVGITTGFLFENDSVLVDAHLYGAIGGLIFALAYLFFENPQPSQRVKETKKT